MKYRNHVSLLLLILLAWIASGCDSRPAKPLPPIPKSQPKVEDQYTPIDREAVEAANQPTADVNQPSSEDIASSGRAANGEPKEAMPVVDKAGGLPWLDADGSQLPMEYWEVQYFNAQRIGITRYRVESDKSGLRIRMETQMQLQSAQRTLRQSILIETREAMDGTLQSFSETLTSGAISSKTNGSVRLREFRLETIADQQNSRKQIEWPEGSWGPLGIHQMLLRTPMRPKEARQAKVFLPQMHQLADVTLVAGEPETTTSPDGLLADVVPIDVVMQLAKEGIRVRMWIDSQGRVQKTIWPEGLNLSSFRITPQMAVKLQSEDELRTYQGTTLAWDPSTLGQDLDIDNAAQVQYTITSEQADPHKLFVTGANQQVKAKPVYEVTLTVHKPDWTNSPPTIKQLPPSLKELSSTEWLPADHAAIQQLADQWSGQTQEPVEIAQNLLQALHQHCHHLDVVSTIHPAPIVAQSLEGNCVELSMVLASLLRNKQIPARLASGLRMVDRDGQSVWAYQMWTEAWLKGHWIPLDPTTGQLTSCAYLKFIDTSLDDSQPYQPVLDVMRALKPLKISQVTIPK